MLVHLSLVMYWAIKAEQSPILDAFTGAMVLFSSWLSKFPVREIYAQSSILMKPGSFVRIRARKCNFTSKNSQ